MCKCTNIHCSPFGFHYEILFPSLTFSLLLQFELWENQDSQGVKVYNGDLKKKNNHQEKPSALTSDIELALHHIFTQLVDSHAGVFPSVKGAWLANV